MEKITFGQIATVLAFLVGVIGSIKYLTTEINKKIDILLKPINKKIDSLELSYIKTDLVNFLSLAERGLITNEQRLNAYELYDIYCKKGGNSYVHDKWENLRKEGKL